MSYSLNEEQLRRTQDEELQELYRQLDEKDRIFETYKKNRGGLEVFFKQVLTSIGPISPLPVKYEPQKKKSKPTIIAVNQTTDSHMGAVQDAYEIGYLNSYDPEICRRRNLGYARASTKYVETMRHGYNINELHWLFTGDLLCFPGQTRITMSDGTQKPISDIKPGMSVLSDPEPQNVISVHKRVAGDEDEYVEIKCCKGLPLKGTSNHVVKRLPREKVEVRWNPGGKRANPFIVRDKELIFNTDDLDECKLSEIRPGDYLTTRPYRPTDALPQLNIAEITGLNVVESDDGTLFKKVRGTSPSIVSKNTIDVDNDLLWLLGMYLAEGSMQKGRSGNVNAVLFTLNINEDNLAHKISQIALDKFGYKTRIDKKPAVSVQNVYINNQIIATLIYKLCGKGCQDKKISPEIYNQPRTLLPLIAGWLDGDGHYTKTGQSLVGKTVSESMARQISTILWSERVAHGYKINRCGLNRDTHVISLSGQYFQMIASYSLTYLDAIKEIKPTYEDGIWIGDCYASRVMSINRSKPDIGEVVYDLHIENNHYYQANGYVVHNSGDIHQELMTTNAFPTPVQVVEAAKLHAQQVSLIAPSYDKVVIHFITADNHSRLTKKPQAGEEGLNSMNYLVGVMMQEYLSRHENVEFNLYPTYEKIVDIGIMKYLVTHGHGIKGWAGHPWYGIERKVSREATFRMAEILLSYDQQAALKELGFHKMVHGHFHTDVNTPTFSCAASVQGATAFDLKNSRISQPGQPTWLVGEHGEFARTNFQLKIYDNETNQAK